MAGIIWLPVAQEDLKAIFQYIYRESPGAAVRLFNLILSSTKHLEEFSDASPIEPLLKGRTHMYRFVLVKKNYKVLYYVKNETVYIAAVWDCRQNPKALKEKI